MVLDLPGVRPVLKLSPEVKMRVGEKFSLYGHKWTAIGEDRALCDDLIGTHSFRDDYKAEDAGDYEESDIKRYIEDWLKYKQKGVV